MGIGQRTGRKAKVDLFPWNVLQVKTVQEKEGGNRNIIW